MCGISGYIDLKRQTQPIELLNLTNVIRHRGPDGEGYVFFNENEEAVTCFGMDTNQQILAFESKYRPTADVRMLLNNYQIGFGHRRLSILDVSPRGHMPMCDEEKHIWLTYNGEVYNYKEIRTQLLNLGYNFITETDSEVVIKAYLHWGTDCLKYFMGMFAFAIYDNRNNNVFLARDRFGIKPFYYYTNSNGVFYFGSEIKQIINTTNFKSHINNQRAYDYLFYSLTDHTDETMFQHVFHLPASHYYYGAVTELPKYQGQKLTTKQWYQLNPNEVDMPYAEACNHFTSLFEQSLSLHLRSDVPLAAALSGGLDSTAIVCQAIQLLKKQGLNNRLTTFSSVATDERYSEKKWIDAVVSYTGVEANFVYPGPERLLELNDKILWHMDEPYQSQSAYLGYHVFESAASKGFKVLLNGQGADEYLSAYQEFKNIRLTRDLYKGRFKQVKDNLNYDGMSNISAARFMMQLVLNQALPKSAKQAATKFKNEFLQIKQLGSDRWNNAVRKLEHPLAHIKYSTKSPIAVSKLQLFHTSLPKYLRWEDRNSMAHGIEARVPFLDHRLVEFVLGLPLQYVSQQAHTPKPLLSDGLRNILPPIIANRKDKMGFITPEQAWIKSNDANELFHTFFKKVKESPFFEPTKVFGYFSMLKNSSIPFNYNYWRIMSLVNWHQLHQIND